MTSTVFHVPAHFAVLADGDDSCLLFSETGNLRLTGIAAAIARAAKAPVTVDQLYAVLSPDYGPLDIQAASLDMVRRGLLGMGEPSADHATLVAERIDPQAFVGAPVPVVVLGDVEARPILDALARLGMRGDVVGEELTPDEVPVIVLIDDVLNPDLPSLGEALFSQARTWLLVRPTGLVSWVGPWFEPEGEYCSECLLDRARGLKYVEITAGNAGLGDQIRAYPSSIAGAAAVIAAECAALEVARRLAGTPPVCAGAVLTWDQRTMETRRHLVSQRPQCRQCGDPTLLTRPQPAITLVESETRSGEGGLRTRDPLMAWERTERLVSPITGITGAIRRSQGLPDDVHLYVAGPVLGSSWTTVSEIRKSFVPGGKGSSATQARMSALGEAIERHSGIWREPREQRWHSWNEVADTATHPQSLIGFSDRQYARREITNQTGRSKVHWVPRRLDDAEVVSWTSAWSLTHGEPRLLPTSYCYLEFREPGIEPFCLGDTNGCAAGSTLEEAILQGLLEVVERDAAAIWWYNRIQREGIHVSEASVAQYAELGRTIDLIDITSDNGVPVYAAVSAESESRRGIVVGFGAHPDPAIAIDRAITEGLQCAQAVHGPIDPMQRMLLTDISLDSDPWLTSSRQRAIIDPRAPRRIAAAVEWIVDRLREQELDVIVLDQTLPDVGLPVVRVAVPGMPHFWPRFGHARLYDVPVAMGHLTTATPEEELNPIPITW